MAVQEACREWAARQAASLEDMERSLGGAAQLLQACADAENAAPRCGMLKVGACPPLLWVLLGSMH